jgi:hypothetical protein
MSAITFQNRWHSKSLEREERHITVAFFEKKCEREKKNSILDHPKKVDNDTECAYSKILNVITSFLKQQRMRKRRRRRRSKSGEKRIMYRQNWSKTCVKRNFFYTAASISHTQSFFLILRLICMPLLGYL